MGTEKGACINKIWRQETPVSILPNIPRTKENKSNQTLDHITKENPTGHT